MQQLHALANRVQVCCQVQTVRCYQRHDQPADGHHEAPTELQSDQLAQAVPSGQRHPIADLLGRHHQRQDERHGPQHPVGIGCTGLGVGGDTGWVIVGGAGHKAGAEHTEEAPDRGPLLGARPGLAIGTRLQLPRRASGGSSLGIRAHL